MSKKKPPSDRNLSKIVHMRGLKQETGIRTLNDINADFIRATEAALGVDFNEIILRSEHPITKHFSQNHDENIAWATSSPSSIDMPLDLQIIKNIVCNIKDYVAEFLQEHAHYKSTNMQISGNVNGKMQCWQFLEGTVQIAIKQGIIPNQEDYIEKLSEALEHAEQLTLNTVSTSPSSRDL